MVFFRFVLALSFTSGLLQASTAGAVTPAAAKPQHAPVRLPVRMVAPHVRRPDAEQLLIEIYRLLGANQLRAAQAKADALVAAYPNFRLGQLVRGDLLMMHTHNVKDFGGASGGSPEALANLRDEAMARLKSLRYRPDPNLLPKSVLQLRDDQKFVLLVDAKRSRLYVYQNAAGQLKFLTDYYISQGKLGVNKLREGDQKTPLGVYYITSRLAGARLPDFYGTGALPINYPNDWDRVNGRSGSGIWLHGTPPDSFSRPPLSSDGCVVLANPDLNKLLASIEIGKTPVVISDQVEFVSKEKWNVERNLAMRVLDGWRLDAESANATRIGANYSRRFKSDRGEDLAAWLTKHRDFVGSSPGASLKLRDVTSFVYPGKEEMLVITFTQEAATGKNRVLLNRTRKRQYWAHEGAQWKIVSESIL
ncbi:MAG: L,D-transpeptidase family protein [Herminiimonas sp.]|nr:L,D-transpeptidase family protein [Herminiimonas sp.]